MSSESLLNLLFLFVNRIGSCNGGWRDTAGWSKGTPPRVGGVAGRASSTDRRLLGSATFCDTPPAVLRTRIASRHLGAQASEPLRPRQRAGPARRRSTKLGSGESADRKFCKSRRFLPAFMKTGGDQAPAAPALDAADVQAPGTAGD